MSQAGSGDGDGGNLIWLIGTPWPVERPWCEAAIEVVGTDAVGGGCGGDAVATGPDGGGKTCAANGCCSGGAAAKGAGGCGP